MAALLVALAPEVPALIAALAQSGTAIFAAIQQANAVNSKPDPTPADWAALDAALSTALDSADVLQAATALRRAAALKTPKKAG